MTRLCFVLAGVSAFAPDAFAGLRSDLKSCTQATGSHSARACTRVLKSGRLRKAHTYIAYFNRGWSYRNAGEYNRALDDYDTAARYNPKYADIYYSRAVVYNDKEDRNHALSDLDLYVEHKGTNWIAYFNRAKMLRKMQMFERAQSDLDKADELKPGMTKTKTLRALVDSDLGNHTQALAQLSNVVDKSPKNPEALFARAAVNFRLSRIEDAHSDVNRALAVRKRFPAANVLLGRIYERTGKTAAAKRSYNEALAPMSKSVTASDANKTARARLSMLGEKKSTTQAAAAQTVVSAADKSTPSDCRRYVPAAGVTIAVSCD